MNDLTPLHGWTKQVEQGRQAYRDGLPGDSNRYHYFRNTPENIGKAGAWESGWQHEKAISNNDLTQGGLELVPAQAHNLIDAGSNPAPATK